MKDSPSPKTSALKILSSLKDLTRVEACIREKFSCEAPLLTEIPSYLLDLGGKRIRPALSLLSARLFGMDPASDELIDAAAAIELIHMATLMHDDIIDHSLMRRSAPSPLAKYGVGNTLVAGDFLLVRAFSLCARLDKHIIAQSEKGCIELTEGEIMETPLYQEHHTLKSALMIARKKTASLFRLATHCGAYLADARNAATQEMSSFGESLGIAFQILDDILDAAPGKNHHGKPTGIDLRERKPSLVNLLWLNSGSSLAQRLLSPPDAHEENFIAAALEEIHSLKILHQAKKLAHKYVQTARTHLQRATARYGAPCLEALAGLEALLDYTLSRAE